ncbi:MAG: NHL repeat-containing protein, partial [Sedimentisphaerales bacterium]|nr:NHL repeat-containing protein [Sedimentisphaerales bacterium]
MGKVFAITCLISLIQIMTAGNAFGAWKLNDGGTHNIDYWFHESDIYIDYLTPGMETTINLLEGGDVQGFDAFEDARINVIGGDAGNLVANGRSQVTITGGSMGCLDADDDSQVVMSSGVVRDNLRTWEDSRVTISGGSVGIWLIALDNSRLSISGGNHTARLNTIHNSRVNWSGGTINGELMLGMTDGSPSGVYGSSAVLTIHGYDDFAIDGNSVGYGEITSILGGDYSDEPVRRLTGTLLSGEPVNNNFRIGYNGKLILSDDRATNPTPADGTMGVDITENPCWTAGINATAHDVYFGTANPPPLVSSNHTGTTYDIPTMSYNTTYYWRIDAKTAGGSITGTTWSFTTCSPSAFYIYVSCLSQRGYEGKIKRINSNGYISTFASGLADPAGLAFGNDGCLYAACATSGVIQKFDSGGNGSVFASGFNYPQCLAFDNSENLYVTNYGSGTINKIDSTGNIFYFASSSAPLGIAFDGSAFLYVSNVTMGPGSIDTFDLSGNRSIFVQDAAPAGIAFDNNGFLYATGIYSGAIVKFDSDGNETVFASGLSYPRGLAFDNNGNLYVAEVSRGAIIKVDPNGNTSTFTSGLHLPIYIAIQAAATPISRVMVDIKPGVCPNPVNVKSKGVLPAAILGTADFDVTKIDPASIRLAGVAPLRSAYKDVAAPASDINDCNCT